MKKLLSLVEHFWYSVPVLTVGIFLGGNAAFASGPPTVCYGTPTSTEQSVITTITGNLTGVAAMGRDLLGATCLIVFIGAAITNHFIHDPRSKERAKEIVYAGLIGVLVAAFAPMIINWLQGFSPSCGASGGTSFVLHLLQRVI